jgi:hypothetical protein
MKPFLLNLNFRYCVHRSPPTRSILSELDAVHTLSHPSPLRSILILSSYLNFSIPSSLFCLGFPVKMYTFLISLVRLHALPITLIILDGKYELDVRGSTDRFPAGAGNFSLHHRVQNGSEAHPASYPMGTRGSFPGGKVVGA